MYKNIRDRKQFLLLKQQSKDTKKHLTIERTDIIYDHR